jgi:hypothetical protein
MKSTFTLFLSIFLSYFAYSQEVANILANQDGDKIQIKYTIKPSDDTQIFRVKVYCSIEEGKKFELKSVAGDVGDNIQGGKSQYLVVWDVLKDVDELKSAEFFVEIKRKDKGSTFEPVSEIKTNKWYIATNTAPISWTFIGARFGFNNNWGGYVAFRLGFSEFSQYYYSDWDDYYNGIFYDNESIPSTLFSITGGVNKEVYKKNQLRLLAYLGGGYGIWGWWSNLEEKAEDIYDTDGNYLYTDMYVLDEYGDWDEGVEIELGITMIYKSLSVSAGYTSLISLFPESGYNLQSDITFGVGYSF